MKKTFLFIALAVTGLVMTACGNDKKEGEDKENVKIEITKDSSMEIDAQAYAQLLDDVLKSDKSLEEDVMNADQMIMGKYNEEQLTKLEEMVNNELKKLGHNDLNDIAMKILEKQYSKIEGLSDENSEMEMSDMEDMPADMNME